MAKSITNVAVTNTFQNWLDKTNEIVSLINNDIMTASPGGDTTVGNATLDGTFTSTNIIANTLLRADTISPKVGSTTITATSPFNVNTNQTILSTFISSTGPRISFSDSVAAWQVGFENITNKNFIITPSGTTGIFRLTNTGNLTLTGSVTATSFIGNVTGAISGNVTGNLTGNVTGNVTGTVSSLSNHTTNALAEGANNLYFTTARARSSISVSGALSYNSTTGVISITDAGIRALFSGGTGVTYNNATGAISIGQPVATTNNVTFANLTTTGTITSTGAITSNGDITAFAASSDIRKKENIAKIDNALAKVAKIGGYTYNFKGDDRRIAGVIAQELERVLPEVIYEIDDEELGKSKAVRYGNIVGLLIEAIKELKTELDELKGSK